MVVCIVLKNKRNPANTRSNQHIPINIDIEFIELKYNIDI